MTALCHYLPIIYLLIWTICGMLQGYLVLQQSPRPNWNGFMQDVTKEVYPQRPDTVMLPIIDLNPNDETCIYSTLLFVIEQSKKLNVTTPSITFDQSLWLKALEIITAEKELDIVPPISGFHMLMSFYGSIGTIMAGSGIDKLFENIYGQNAVKHMLSGKVVARANKARILTESALLIKLQQIALSENSNNGVNNVNLEDIQMLYKTVLSKVEDVDLEIPAMQALKTILEATKMSLQEKSRTARLWLQYVEYVETYRTLSEHPELVIGSYICMPSVNDQFVCCNWAYQLCQICKNIPAAHGRS